MPIRTFFNPAKRLFLDLANLKQLLPGKHSSLCARSFMQQLSVCVRRMDASILYNYPPPSLSPPSSTTTFLIITEPTSLLLQYIQTER